MQASVDLVENDRCPIHAPITDRANTPCNAVPASQTPWASWDIGSNKAAASNNNEMEMAGKKAMRTGWFHSAFTSAPWASAFAP